MSVDVASAEADQTGVPVSKTAMWAAAGLVSVVVVCMTILAALDKDATQILVVVNIVVVPLLAMLGYSRLKSIEEKTDQVQKQTNGNMSKVMDALLTRHVTEGLPPTSTDDTADPGGTRKTV